MLTLSNPAEVQRQALAWKKEGPVALVPTMGALHEGHLQLVRTAKQHARRVIVSIFVNPLQFGPKEDLAKYPRPFEQDQRMLREAGADLLFAPTPADMYGEGFATTVAVPPLAQSMEGEYRPGHFAGVATVCLKLFNVTQCDVAVFGEKDFQQLSVLQRMVADLNLPMRIQPEPTVREADGLALSSRNRYLSPDERRWAAHIPTALRRVQARAKHPQARVGELIDLGTTELTQAPLQIQYLTIASAHDLVPAARDARVETIAEPRIFVAAFAGTTRLIDNVPLLRETL